MSFTPFARWRNFTLENLKYMLTLYPDLVKSTDWSEVGDYAEAKLRGYKKTAYQFGCQLGLENRAGKYKTQSYLYFFDDTNLERYLGFWFKMYVCPNPYVNSDDDPISPFCEIANEVLESPTHCISYTDYCDRAFGEGKSLDIFKNALASCGYPLEVNDDRIFVSDRNVTLLESVLAKVQRTLPMKNNKSAEEFFERFSAEKFAEFYGLPSVEDLGETEPEESEVPAITNRAKFGANKIFYGAPGCGKSRHVSDMLAEVSVAEENIIRVTFHPEYANCDFIGQILPTVEMKKDETTGEEKEIVKYIFNPGPFTLALQTAYNTNEMVFLIVEEINRGNAAAIFGDMFQLLDRVKESDKPNYCASEYPVSNPNMQKYLMDTVPDEAIRAELKNGIFIPSNLTIYATMNSSDQNVFTLDTAFKRRWSFEQISNDISKDTSHAYKHWYIPGTEVTWADFLTKLNDKILDYKLQNQTNEDKRLGKYFVAKDCLVDPANIPDDVSEIAQNFAYKVLEYIWNDVCKIGREEWFDTEHNKTLEALIEAFINPKEGETPLSVFQNITF